MSRCTSCAEPGRAPVEPPQRTLVPAPGRRVARLPLPRELDGSAEQRLSAAYAGATEAGAEVVVLDFAHTEYMNCPGIALLVSLLAAARGQGVKIRTAGVSHHYRDIFEITGLAEALNIEAAAPTRA